MDSGARFYEPFLNYKTMLEPMTDSELDALCNYLASASYVYYPIATSFFSDLYNTGCRPMELLLVERWQYISSAQILLTPLKGNDIRDFTESELSTNLVFAIQNQIKPYHGLSLRQLESVLQKIIPVLKPQTIDKSAISYIFRYNKAKQLKAAGYNDAQLMSIFGWSSTAYASLYTARTIYRNSPLPPELFNYVTDESGNPLIDNNGDNIIFS